MKNKIFTIIAVVIVIIMMVVVYLIENRNPVINIEWQNGSAEIKKDLDGDGVEEVIRSYSRTSSK